MRTRGLMLACVCCCLCARQPRAGGTGIDHLTVSGFCAAGYSWQQQVGHGPAQAYALDRALLGCAWRFSRVIAAIGELDAVNGQLWRAYLDAQYARWGIAAGIFPVPFGLSLLTVEREQRFIQRPVGVQRLFCDRDDGRDLGVAGRSRAGPLRMDLACVNGSGRDWTDDDGRPAVIGRASVGAAGVRLGGSLYNGSIRAGGVRCARERRGAFLVIADGGDGFEAEYYNGTDADIRSAGWYLQGSAGIPLIAPRVARALRVYGLIRIEQWDPDRRQDDDEETMTTFGIACRPNAHLRLVATIELHSEKPSVKNNQFRAQAQAGF